MPKAKETSSTPSGRTDPQGNKGINTVERKPAANKVKNAKSTAEAKGDSQAGNYLLLVQLAGTECPNIQRLISIPSDATFQKLHQALQISFGWATCHLHQFTVQEQHDTPYIMGRLLLRLVAEPEACSIEIEEGQELKADPAVSLADIFENDPYQGRTTVVYEYDFGDSWEHEILLLGRADAALGKRMGIEQDIVCLAGQGHGCAEDCGGVVGWEHLKGVFAKPRGDKFRKDWYKNMCANSDAKGLDPWKWDILKINEELGGVRLSILSCLVCAVTDLTKI